MVWIKAHRPNLFVWWWFIQLTESKTAHPSIHVCWSVESVGKNEEDNGPFQDQHKHAHTQTHTLRSNLQSLINLMLMFSVCGSRLEYPGKTHVHTGHDGIKPVSSPVCPTKANYMDQWVYMWGEHMSDCACGFCVHLSNMIVLSLSWNLYRWLVKRLACHIFDSPPPIVNLVFLIAGTWEMMKKALHSAALGLWYRSTFQYRWNH